FEELGQRRPQLLMAPSPRLGGTVLGELQADTDPPLRHVAQLAESARRLPRRRRCARSLVLFRVDEDDVVDIEGLRALTQRGMGQFDRRVYSSRLHLTGRK